MKQKRLSINAQSANEVEYRDLTPIDDAKDCSEQINALRWAINNPKVKNIALTGPYGSGKSSIINTFLKSEKEIKKKSIRISLANFKGVPNNEETENDAANHPLAQEILKQLFYKVKQKHIPQSRYRKLRKVCYWPICLFLVLFAIVGLIFSFVFLPEDVKKCFTAIAAAGEKCNMLPWLSYTLFTGLLLGLIATIARCIQLFSYRISVKEIEIPGAGKVGEKAETQNSVFNKNMDEIVYFFEETDYAYVFIEDLDRFDDPSIFVQLRDLNILLNNYDAISHKIVFVYAIKDDMFRGTERTKFFDFIIPVIPVINSTNSGDILLKLLQAEDGSGFKHEITQGYILDVAPYISDMRVLQNIYNEFIIYKSTLKIQQGLGLKDHLMLSLIIFKNLYPTQFAELHEEKGIIKQAFKDKTAFIECKQIDLTDEADKLREILANINQDVLKSEQEVKLSLLREVTKGLGIAYNLSSGGKYYSAEEILQRDFDMSKLQTDGSWSIGYMSLRGNTNSTSSRDVAKITSEYVERIEYLKYAQDDEQLRIKKEIETIEENRRMLSALSLEQLCEEYGADSVLSDGVSDNKLLVFMLRKGYINERYADYINFFKGNSITTGDKNYILSVKDQTPKPFSYTLTKCSEILNRLQLHEFSERAVLNFNLLEYMLQNCQGTEKLHAFIRQLANESRDSWNFIDEFVDITNHQRDFMQKLAFNWSKFWDDIYGNVTLTYERKLSYLGWLCWYCDSETLQRLNASGLITAFFVENEDVLQRLSPSLTERLIRIIPALGIMFCKIKISNVPTALLDHIFDNQWYELNANMIYSVVEYKDASLCSYLNTQNYTTITRLSYLPLVDYVHDNLGEYIKEIFLTDENTQETAEATAKLLARCLMEYDLCEEIIKHQNCTIDSFAMVCYEQIQDNSDEVQALWDLLLTHNKVRVSWENVALYWENFTLSKELISFISGHADVLSKENCDSLDDGFKKAFIQSDINASVFNQLLDCMRMDNFDIPLEDISDSKLEPMLKAHYFAFSDDAYQELEECSPNWCVEFVVQNQDDFLQFIDSISLSPTVFEQLVLNERLEQSIKEKILNKYGTEMMSEKTAMWLCTVHTNITRSVLSSAWEKLHVSDLREKMFFMYLYLLEEADFEAYLTLLGQPYNKLIRKDTRHEEFLQDTPNNQALAERLQKVGYITSYSSEDRLQISGETRIRIPVIRFRLKAKSSSKVLASIK